MFVTYNKKLTYVGLILLYYGKLLTVYFLCNKGHRKILDN